ncbi:VOC family protein [Belnapia rosea]|uniref:Catechol 2,3-dioxygenase n=1 Tax=Belnapia rosea TaxID=938405 RepID=A0A1G6QM12_9PROT|nr:VOC family protein [Belnapia rosea]SDC93358.1 Catechol 2,3-dioxygenase [Belnapia rosea]
MPSYIFDHVHLRSPNPEATAAWFEEMLGAEIIRSTQQGKPRIDMKVGGQDVFIIQADGAAAAPPSAPYQGIDHFGLSVQGLDEAVAGLKAKGVQFTMEPTSPRPGIRICFIRGPENISIELLERTPA